MESLLGTLAGEQQTSQSMPKQETGQALPSSLQEDAEAPPPKKQYQKSSGSQTKVCACLDTVLFEKVKILSMTEGITVRSIMEYALGKAIENYEARHGKIRMKRKRKGDIEDVFG